ncbi:MULTISPECIES: SDR family NAD(P)-dependent oxidoreductase [Aneurinibacillus]|uniref:3-oxoacyl-[acyl-carrier protein] reductase n=1 Tax=Aneurinibacillus thermoaerophilus TaxID=143495 RepID=A0A1G7YZ35_ANETH|nr:MULTISPECIES: glucose 1-dehydrogenase [Aneurinibacillus]AMA73135.1 short-chain dehydrogenase [Aneurinibacillus sp. XH2]MED0678466.1 SDR family oxidoreductase [Aneurinibacillus thermoaerophilus]MED0736010.1 SDR family oxidoreductase [Aneurinibacillus thermoaerophilus]MED0756157.1 SDR family oxidoreductase [Aneurinibacillus thermoaerophilus]MED0762390.1 SDR family oxidoreductase [Aneurinibacillus thermoaerophilus]
MDLGLKDKVVLITGGSKGIGRAIARAFYEEEAKVAIAARGETELQEAAAEMDGILALPADLTDREARKSIINQVVNNWGTVDVLVNNVGGSNGGTVLDTDLELFQAAMDINFYPAVDLSKAVIPLMKEKGAGSIINISSIYGRESGGKPTYNAAKAALISFTKALANEVIPYGIRVNGIAPGSILHPTGNWQKRLQENPEKIKQFVKNEIPAGRFGTVEEVANVAVFLASEKASWVVGATLNVDGGQSRSNF